MDGQTALLPYPPLSDDLNLVRGIFCYVIEAYKPFGISCLVQRSDGKVQVAIGDFDGKPINLAANSSEAILANSFAKQYVGLLVEFTKLVNVGKVLYYFSISDDTTMKLVDARVSINKFLGPGMLRDVFGKRIPTQETILIEVIDDVARDKIEKGQGFFARDLIIKPIRYRFLPNGDPCYVCIKRG